MGWKIFKQHAYEIAEKNTKKQNEIIGRLDVLDMRIRTLETMVWKILEQSKED